MLLNMQCRQAGRIMAGVGALACMGLTSQVDAAPVAIWDFETDFSTSSTAGHVSGGDLEFIELGSSDWARAFDIAVERGVAADGSTYVDGNPINRVSMSSVNAGNSAFARTWPGIDNPVRAFAFTLTVEEGYELHLADLTFDLGFARGSVTNVRVELSTVADFSDAVIIGSGSGWASEAQAGLGYGVDGSLGVLRPEESSHISWNRYVNDAGVSDLAPLTGTVYFRIAGWGANWSQNDARTNLHMDNLTVNGQLIPEPASLALLGLGGLILAGRRRNISKG